MRPACTAPPADSDNYSAIEAAGFKVFGISADNPKPQANWRAKHAFPYGLLCDPSRDALKALGILQGGKIVRSHIVAAKGGKLIDVRCGAGRGAAT
jgi:peroxiredoxin